jgi:hypothetical protein
MLTWSAVLFVGSTSSSSSFWRHRVISKNVAFEIVGGKSPLTRDLFYFVQLMRNSDGVNGRCSLYSTVYLYEVHYNELVASLITENLLYLVVVWILFTNKGWMLLLQCLPHPICKQ